MTKKELLNTYKKIRKDILARIAEFESVWDKGEEAVLAELIFCVLTPQSSARGCWSCVERIINKKLLVTGNEKQILAELTHARFKYKKAKYAVLARAKFMQGKKLKIREKIASFKTEFEAREWLVENIKGYGYKEAGHFLRNIGRGKTLAILDRHIMRNLKALGVIRSISETLTKKKYFEIEKKMAAFSKKVKIPLEHLDLLFWYASNGEIYK